MERSPIDEDDQSGAHEAMIQDAENAQNAESMRIPDTLGWATSMRVVSCTILTMAARSRQRCAADDALANMRRERDGEEALRSFDIPPGEHAAAIDVFPQTYDEVIGRTLLPAMMARGARQHRYGDRMLVQPMIFADNPRQGIRESIRIVQDRVTHVDLTLHSHGTPEEELATFRPPLNWDDIEAVINEFPRLTFVIRTDACYGANLRPRALQAMEDDNHQRGLEEELGIEHERRPLQERVHVFTQGRPNMPVFFMVDRPNAWFPSLLGTQYDMGFIQALYNGRGLGEASLEGRRLMRRMSPNHPEAIIRGQLVHVDGQSEPKTTENA